MRVYKLTIAPRSSFRTPLQSDTIFGHLLWAIRYLEGEDALSAFLGLYRSDGPPPLLVSAGFPAGMLPIPVMPSIADEGTDSSIADRVVGAMLAERYLAEDYLPLEQWREIASNLSPTTLAEARARAWEQLAALKQMFQTRTIMRTAVDRITGAAREGRLFPVEETLYAPQARLEIWHKLSEEGLAYGLLARLDAYWRWIERTGFGKRKSSGHGGLEIIEPLRPADNELPHVENPNAFVSLSAWVPTEGDPTDVTYRTRIKRGKLAELYALRNPWKKPLIMLAPGAVARLPAGEAVREWYGGLVERIHWTMEGIVQYGYAFPLPVRMV